METTSKSNITYLQTVALVSTMIFGVGILTLSRSLASEMKTADGWISVIIGGIISVLVAWISVKLCKRYPKQTFYQYCPTIVGKWFGWLLNILFVIYFIILAGYEARMMSEVNHFFVLEGIPKPLMIIIYLLVGNYLILGGINALGRLGQMLLFPTLGIFLFMMFFSLKIFEVDNLRPVLATGIQPILKGVPVTVFSYLGFEILLFITAFMSHPEKAGKAVAIGILLPMITYLSTVILVFGGLNIDEAATLTWPTISLITQLEFPGIIFERFESVLMTIWTIEIFTTFVISHYLAALGCQQVFNKKFSICAYFVIPFIYVASIFPETLNDLFKEGDYLGYTFLLLGVVVPAFLLLISYIRGGTKKEDEKTVNQ